MCTTVTNTPWRNLAAMSALRSKSCIAKQAAMERTLYRTKTFFLPLRIRVPPTMAPIAFPTLDAKLINELFNLVYAASHPNFAAKIGATWL